MYYSFLPLDLEETIALEHKLMKAWLECKAAWAKLTEKWNTKRAITLVGQLDGPGDRLSTSKYQQLMTQRRVKILKIRVTGVGWRWKATRHCPVGKGCFLSKPNSHLISGSTWRSLHSRVSKLPGSARLSYGEAFVKCSICSSRAGKRIDSRQGGSRFGQKAKQDSSQVQSQQDLFLGSGGHTKASS